MSEGIKMRPSRVLAKMRRGETAICTKGNLADPRAVEIAGMFGFDCYWTCMEHVPNSIHDIENQVRVAKMTGMDIVVRVRRGSYSDLVLPLEMDATAVMVPHVMSLEEAKEIVYYTKFHPVGRRPWDGGNADGAYCMMPGSEYIEQANRERFNILQIEDPEVLDDLEAIAQLDGVDMIFFGPGDFSQSIGDPANFDNPLIGETRKRIADVCKKYGKFAGTVGHLGNYQELSDMGYQFINIGADVIALCDYYKDISEKLGMNVSNQKAGYYK